MTHVLAQGDTFIDLPAVITGPDGTTYPRSIVDTSDAAFLAMIGVYELVPAAVPEGKVATSIKRALKNGKVVETAVLADAPPPPIPQEVTKRQAKLALLGAGLLDQADAAIAGLTGQAGKAAKIDWADAQTFRRDNPLILGIGANLGLGEAQIDQLFVQAAKIV